MMPSSLKSPSADMYAFMPAAKVDAKRRCETSLALQGPKIGVITVVCDAVLFEKSGSASVCNRRGRVRDDAVVTADPEGDRRGAVDRNVPIGQVIASSPTNVHVPVTIPAKTTLGAGGVVDDDAGGDVGTVVGYGDRVSELGARGGTGSAESVIVTERFALPVCVPQRFSSTPIGILEPDQDVRPAVAADVGDSEAAWVGADRVDCRRSKVAGAVAPHGRCVANPGDQVTEPVAGDVSRGAVMYAPERPDRCPPDR